MKISYQSPGIDHSYGMANVNYATGIHVGVIHQGEVLQAWADSSEPDYGQPDEIECPECGFLFTPADGTAWGDVIECMDNPAHEIEVEIPMDAEPISFVLDDGEYSAWTDDRGDILVEASPYYTYCVYCNLCAPGAGYLMSPFRIPEQYRETSHALEQISPDTYGELYQDLAKAAGFPMVYCFGHDFFDDGRALYRVFDVKTKQEVRP